MKTPGFWYGTDDRSRLIGRLLSPLGLAWSLISERKYRSVKHHHMKVPVICVGNLVAGGAGKTPVALSLAEIVPGFHYLSRGYGGRLLGPILVQRHHHTHDMVGDEPLLLAEAGPCWVSKDRLAGARAAISSGAHCIILDDGFQNPLLVKDLSLLVVDGKVGFGNGRCIPAGPLREPLERGLARADAVVIIGDDATDAAEQVRQIAPDLPVLRAHLETDVEAEGLNGERVIAFAGIGRPDKFFETLESKGAEIVEAYAFPDHYPYHPSEISELLTEAESKDATLMTTAKDYVRLPHHQQEQIGVLTVALVWDDEEALRRVLAPVLNRLAEADSAEA